MKYENVLFDLDGTLTDSKPGIINSIRQAFRYFDINYDTMDLNQFIGPPLMNTLVDSMGMDFKKAEEVVKKYRDYYSQTGIFENSLYDGIQEMLAWLKDKGHNLVIATSKPSHFTNIVLKHFNISQYFSYIAASDFNRSFDTKQRVIEDALKQCNITDLCSTVMIGDRKYDIIAAKAVGIAAIGVLYGYGNYDELSEAGADFIVENVQELFNLIKEEN